MSMSFPCLNSTHAFYENENGYFRSIKFYKVEVKLVHLTFAEKKILSYLRNQISLVIFVEWSVCPISCNINFYSSVMSERYYITLKMKVKLFYVKSCDLCKEKRPFLSPLKNLVSYHPSIVSILFLRDLMWWYHWSAVDRNTSFSRVNRQCRCLRKSYFQKEIEFSAALCHLVWIFWGMIHVISMSVSSNFCAKYFSFSLKNLKYFSQLIIFFHVQ